MKDGVFAEYIANTTESRPPLIAPQANPTSNVAPRTSLEAIACNLQSQWSTIRSA